MAPLVLQFVWKRDKSCSLHIAASDTFELSLINSHSVQQIATIPTCKHTDIFPKLRATIIIQVRK